jgi:lipopolysaccharide transport protein LptA
VNGKGLMQMETKTDFQGNALSRPSTLEVLWDETMDFHGGFVEFHGGVQASQGASRLRCENLQVYFDRDISLKEGNKGQPSPHARKITADNKVWVEERTPAANGRDLAGFQRLDCLELNVLTEDNQVWAQGPGWVRTVQPGGGDLDLSPRSAAPPKPTPNGEWRLTLVNYATRMVADNKKRTATFTGDVKVLYVGWELKRANDPIDVNQVVDELPRGGIWMEADRLTVYAGQGKGAKDKTLDAFGKVRLKAVDEKNQVFWGSAEEVHYDEEKDQVILDGKDGVARLSVIERKGAPPKRIEGKKIFYQRKTGTFDGQGLTELTGATGGR